jgi:primosomal protein N' (replication factor Y)
MQFPPYQSLANLIFAGKQNAQALAEAREFAKYALAFKNDSMRLIGPAIAAMARLKGLNRYQLLLKSPTRKGLRDCLRAALQQFRKNTKRNAQLTIDIDPYSLT